MKQIKSQKEKNKILHLVFNKEDIVQDRIDLINDENFLQCAAIKHQKGKKFAAHRHLWNDNKFSSRIAQEAWIVISGSVKVFYYDLDGKFLTEQIISTGDITITLEGGHSYEILEEDTIVYEFKTGPYEGQVYDKVFL